MEAAISFDPRRKFQPAVFNAHVCIGRDHIDIIRCNVHFIIHLVNRHFGFSFKDLR